MVKFKKKIQLFQFIFSFVSFHFPFAIDCSIFKIFPIEKNCFRDAKKKENRFYARKCSCNVETSVRCFY